MSREEKAKEKKQGLLSRIFGRTEHSREENTIRQGAGPVRDLSYVLLGFLFGGCHFAFGAYPLGISLVSVLPHGILAALIGVVLGSLTLGKIGIIYALITILAVLLRIVISGGKTADSSARESATPETENGKKRSGSSSFLDLLEIFGLSEQPLIARISCAIISGFIAAMYEILLSGISIPSALFGITMILSPAVIVFVLCGFFDAGITYKELFFGGKSVVFAPLSKSKRGTAALLDGIHLRVSLLLILFMISASLKKYTLFGIDTALVFSAASTLFAAKRFGALYGGVTGFVTSFGVVPLYSVSFTLAGLGTGALFPVGTGYALLGGCVLLSAWGAYAGGVLGVLSVLIEYSLSAICMLPLFRFFERESASASDADSSRRALDMVGTMALAYRNKSRESSEALESTLHMLAPMIKRFLAKDRARGRATANFHPDAKSSPDDYYELFARIFEQTRRYDDENREMDEPLTEKAEALFAECGFTDGVIRVFGKRRKYIICAGEDKTGELITSPRLISGLEECIGYKLSLPEYFRRQDMVLMECSAVPKLRLETEFAVSSGTSGEISGDSLVFFETAQHESYILISDGMGSGKEALETSGFVCSFLSKILSTGAGVSASLHALNGIIRERNEECSATVDLMRLDLLSGSAVFVKSAAPPSYIKRGGSLFRIKSETMPIGLLKSIDAESITANIYEGDVIIMLSDGITENGDDAPWLLELLNEPFSADAPLKSFAQKIIRAASERKSRRDDMTAVIARVCAANKK